LRLKARKALLHWWKIQAAFGDPEGKDAKWKEPKTPDTESTKAVSRLVPKVELDSVRMAARRASSLSRSEASHNFLKWAV